MRVLLLLVLLRGLGGTGGGSGEDKDPLTSTLLTLGATVTVTLSLLLPSLATPPCCSISLSLLRLLRLLLQLLLVTVFCCEVTCRSCTLKLLIFLSLGDGGGGLACTTTIPSSATLPDATSTLLPVIVASPSNKVMVVPPVGAGVEGRAGGTSSLSSKLVLWTVMLFFEVSEAVTHWLEEMSVTEVEPLISICEIGSPSSS